MLKNKFAILKSKGPVTMYYGMKVSCFFSNNLYDLKEKSFFLALTNTQMLVGLTQHVNITFLVILICLKTDPPPPPPPISSICSHH